MTMLLVRWRFVYFFRGGGICIPSVLMPGSHLHVKPSCKKHVWQFSRNGVEYGYLVEVTGARLRGCYGVHVTNFQCHNMTTSQPGAAPGCLLRGGGKMAKCLATAARAQEICANPGKSRSAGGGGGGDSDTFFFFQLQKISTEFP